MEITDELIDFNLNFIKSEYDNESLVTETDFVDLDGNPSDFSELIARELDRNNLIETLEKAYLLSKHGTYVLSVGGWRRYLELENNQLESELEEQSMQIKESAQIRTLELENALLTSENLKLQNKQLKRATLYAVIGFILGAIITNVELILNLLNIKFQEP